MLDDFDNAGAFFTDSNEGMMMKREYNKRPGWELKDMSSNISANFYPVDAAIAMRSQNV